MRVSLPRVVVAAPEYGDQILVLCRGSPCTEPSVSPASPRKIAAIASPCEGPYPPSRTRASGTPAASRTIEVSWAQSSGRIAIELSGSSARMSWPAETMQTSGPNSSIAGAKIVENTRA